MEKSLEEILKSMSEAIVYFDGENKFGFSDRIFELMNDIKDEYNISDTENK